MTEQGVYQREPEWPLFAAFAGEQSKKVGMQRAADKKRSLLSRAQQIARELPRATVGVTADDVVAAMLAQGITEPLGNAAGSLFRGSEWEFTGERRTSKRPQAHANELKVWRLINAD